MANYGYKIKSCTGKEYIVPENETNNETPITLIGHGQPEYGVDQNTNFLHMLENFASPEEPVNPVRGQVWYKIEEIEDDKGIKSLTNNYKFMICKNPEGATEEDRWDATAHVATNSGDEPPTNPSNGDIWYDSGTHKFKVYDGELKEWNMIGPTDAVHSEHIFVSSTFNAATRKTTYTYDAGLFKDVTNDGDPNFTKGSMNLITLKIIAKEIPETDYSTDLKSCAWIYKFAVQSIKTSAEGSWIVDLVGAPSYELIAKTDDTNWSASVTTVGATIQVTVSAPNYTTGGRHVVVGFDSDIARV